MVSKEGCIMISIVKITILSLLVCGAYQPLSASSNRNNLDDVAREDKAIRPPSLSLESGDISRSIPTGSVISFAGDKAPDGWLLCDGKKYSNQTYPQLYSVISTKYVPQNHWIHESNESTQPVQLFLVPDMRGRTSVGVDDKANRVTTNNTLGASSGEEKHLLTLAEMPSHDHEIQCRPQTQLGGLYPHDIIVPGITQNITVSRTTNHSGNNQSHNNMQPYLMLNYIIKTGQEEADDQRNRTAQRDVELDSQRSRIVELEQKLNNLEIDSAKAWVVFNGTNATILNSYGVSSVIKTSLARYTINFSKPFSSVNYCFSLNAGTAASVAAHAMALEKDLPTKTSFTLTTYNFQGGNYEAAFISACFYGKQ